jgi:site-specific recombinase XerD
MRDLDIHKIGRRFECALEKLEKSSIRKEDKELILEFVDFAMSNGLTKTRILKYVNTLRVISSGLKKPFKDASKQDIMHLVRKVEQSDYSEWTKHDYKAILKRFYKWFNGDEVYPEAVRWIKTGIRKNKRKLPEELLSPEDVNKMIEVAHHSRDKALVSFLYETGCRIGEVLTMKIKHVVFDEYGAKVTVDGKTGMRRVRVFSSVPYLATWMSNHHLKNNPEAPLWVAIGTRNRNEVVKYPNIRLLITELAKKAGIKKRVHPHLFRHSRATNLAKHFTDAQMNQYFGWVQGSGMPSTYIHLSGKDLDGTLLKMHGFKKEDEDKEDIYSPITCFRCEKINPPAGKFCLRCGAPLDQESAIKLETERRKMDNVMSSLLKEMLKEPEIRKFISGKLKEIKIGTPS